MVKVRDTFWMGIKSPSWWVFVSKRTVQLRMLWSCIDTYVEKSICSGCTVIFVSFFGLHLLQTGESQWKKFSSHMIDPVVSLKGLWCQGIYSIIQEGRFDFRRRWMNYILKLGQNIPFRNGNDWTTWWRTAGPSSTRETWSTVRP